MSNQLFIIDLKIENRVGIIIFIPKYCSASRYLGKFQKLHIGILYLNYLLQIIFTHQPR